MSEKHPQRAPLSNAPRRSARTPRQVRYRVADKTALKPGESLKYLMPIRGAEEECFMINFHGHFHAFVNRCRHVPMAMDWLENQFFAEQGRYLICQTHNADYEPASGHCVARPAEPGG